MTSITNNYQLHQPERQRGFSLVELMISMVISLILLGGITLLIVQQSQTRDELEKSSRQIENGRYAIEILRDDIQHAGFYGQYFTLPAPPGVLPDPCLTDTASLVAGMPLAIQGYDSPAASPLSCIPNANFLPGTDILVVRRADTITNLFDAATPPLSTTALPAGQIFLQTNTASAVVAAGAGNKGTTTTFPLAYDAPPSGPGNIRAPLRPYIVHIYFVSPCSTMANGATCTATDDSGRPIPTLKRMDLSAIGGATTFIMTPLVEGIENMQLDYGLDTDPSTNGDGYPDIYTASPAATAWFNVMSVKVNLLARNNDPTAGYVDTKSYTLGSNTAITIPVAINNYKRHVFSVLVRAVNPSGRRAQQ